MEPKPTVENCTHFRHPTDEQLGHVDIFFSDYYNFQSVYFEEWVSKASCVLKATRQLGTN